MKTIKSKQRFKTIINAIRLAETHYPEKVVIEENERGLSVFSRTSDTFNNLAVIEVANTLSASRCYLIYEEDIKKIVLRIF